jgi:hypothetical protein
LESITLLVYWSNNKQKAISSSDASIQMKTRLTVMLCWIAGASYLDLCFAYGVSSSTFNHSDSILWSILEAIGAVFAIGLASIR